jgi:rubrerythrin
MSNQAQFEDALKELVELHFDAVEAYETALNKIEDHEYKKKLYDFKNDHLRHINEFSDLLRKHNVEPPT